MVVVMVVVMVMGMVSGGMLVRCWLIRVVIVWGCLLSSGDMSKLMGSTGSKQIGWWVMRWRWWQLGMGSV